MNFRKLSNSFALGNKFSQMDTGEKDLFGYNGTSYASR